MRLCLEKRLSASAARGLGLGSGREGTFAVKERINVSLECWGILLARGERGEKEGGGGFFSTGKATASSSFKEVARRTIKENIREKGGEKLVLKKRKKGWRIVLEK